MNPPRVSTPSIPIRRIVIWILALAVIASVVTLLLTKPAEISAVFFQMGGRIVSGVAMRPGAVVVGSVVTLLLVWIGIAVRCWWEDSPGERGTSVPR